MPLQAVDVDLVGTAKGIFGHRHGNEEALFVKGCRGMQLLDKGEGYGAAGMRKVDAPPGFDRLQEHRLQERQQAGS